MKQLLNFGFNQRSLHVRYITIVQNLKIENEVIRKQ